MSAQQFPAQLFIVTAPSGAGKTSIVKEVLSRIDGLTVSISHTTRPMRPGDRDGVDYHFTDRAAFQEMIRAGAFFEHAEVFGNFYGTSQQGVIDSLQRGTDVLLEIDWQGARQVRERLPAACSLFLLPPSLEVLRQRLTARASDDPQVIERRLSEAAADMRHFRDSDYFVVNDDFERAVHEVCCVIESQRLRTSHQQKRRTELLLELIGEVAE